MMILDLSQTMISNIMMQIGNHKNAEIDESMIRHMVLNSIRSYLSKFKNQYKPLVIACDNKNYWRKELFPYYKANRKKKQETSEIDWKALFASLNKIRDELKTFFPYQIIEVEHCEADDIISFLVHENLNQQILIISGDKDFQQLQYLPHVKQYDPVRKRFLECNNPTQFLQEHIIRGDAGDGIPNILSPDNCLVVGERQRRVTEKRITSWLNDHNTILSDSELARNYSRNEQLIDLKLIPDDITTKIRETVKSTPINSSGQLMNYFITHRLQQHLQNLQEFIP